MHWCKFKSGELSMKAPTVKWHALFHATPKPQQRKGKLACSVSDWSLPYGQDGDRETRSVHLVPRSVTVEDGSVRTSVPA